MMSKSLNIGTRGSKLALYQANVAKGKIESLFPDISTNIVIIKTKGDKILDTALSKIGDKGLFTKELEVALEENKIDIAVHSLKDMPTSLPENLKLGAVLERGDVADALVSINNKKLDELDKNSIIATSSLRRRANLLRFNPNFNIVDIRGNVNSRLQKMEDGYCDAMIMAAAGLKRLGLDHYISEILPADIFIPAVGQGIIGIESRKKDQETDNILSKLNDPVSWNSALAEREFMHALQGGCQVPVGCVSKLKNNKIYLTGFIATLDGKTYLKNTLSGEVTEAKNIGKLLAENLIEQGGLDILNQIKQDLQL